MPFGELSIRIDVSAIMWWLKLFATSAQCATKSRAHESTLLCKLILRTYQQECLFKPKGTTSQIQKFPLKLIYINAIMLAPLMTEFEPS